MQAHLDQILSQYRITPGVYVVPDYAQTILGMDPALLDQLIANYPGTRMASTRSDGTLTRQSRLTLTRSSRSSNSADTAVPSPSATSQRSIRCPRCKTQVVVAPSCSARSPSRSPRRRWRQNSQHVASRFNFPGHSLQLSSPAGAPSCRGGCENVCPALPECGTVVSRRIPGPLKDRKAARGEASSTRLGRAESMP